MTIAVPPDALQQDPPIDAQTWAVVPRGVLMDARLSDRAVRLYGVLDARSTGRQIAVKISTVAVDLGWSIRKAELAVSELAALGYVSRQRTRGVSLTTVVNPVRSAKSSARSAGSCGSDPQDLAGTSRSTSSRSKNIIRGEAPASPDSPAPTSAADAGRDPLSPYLLAASEGAGVTLDLNRTVKGYLQKIATTMSPEQLRDQVAEWPRISWSGLPIYDLGGFYVGVVLRGIAEGWQPPSSDRPGAAPARETPIPPRIEELYIEDPCEHGDPRGPRACALCRMEWLNYRADAAETGVAACRAVLSQSKSISEEIPA